jgi:hypothetical protein
VTGRPAAPRRAGHPRSGAAHARLALTAVARFEAAATRRPIRAPRELLPARNAIVGIDLAEVKQVTDHDSQVLARRRLQCRGVGAQGAAGLGGGAGDGGRVRLGDGGLRADRSPVAGAGSAGRRAGAAAGLRATAAGVAGPRGRLSAASALGRCQRRPAGRDGRPRHAACSLRGAHLELSQLPLRRRQVKQTHDAPLVLLSLARTAAPVRRETLWALKGDAEDPSVTDRDCLG